MRKNWPANFLDCEQGSPEWLKARNGHVTASRVAVVIGKQKNGKYYADREKYMDELLAEILTGSMTETTVTNEMQFGIENEGLARSEYESKNEVFIDQVGFVLHPRIARCGASPDGMVGKDGGIEIKVPKTVTHLKYLREKVVPEAYRPQILLNMACTEREWWDFFSFDPRLKGDLRRFQVRLYRDEKEIAEMEAEIEKFLEELATRAIQTTESIQSQLERSVEASKAFRKVHDAELMEQLRDEGIRVP